MKGPLARPMIPFGGPYACRPKRLAVLEQRHASQTIVRRRFVSIRILSIRMCDERALCRPGSDLLSRVLRRSTISAGAFHGRVRNGIGCSRSAITTRSAKRTFKSRSCSSAIQGSSRLCRCGVCALLTGEARKRDCASAPSRSIGPKGRSCVSAGDGY